MGVVTAAVVGVVLGLGLYLIIVGTITIIREARDEQETPGR